MCAVNASWLRRLEELKPRLAAAAQELYDDWDEPEEENDFCEELTHVLADVVVERIEQAQVDKAICPDDDHIWLLVTIEGKSYGVDIPPGIFTFCDSDTEAIPARIDPDDICIWLVDMDTLIGEE